MSRPRSLLKLACAPIPEGSRWLSVAFTVPGKGLSKKNQWEPFVLPNGHAAMRNSSAWVAWSRHLGDQAKRAIAGPPPWRWDDPLRGTPWALPEILFPGYFGLTVTYTPAEDMDHQHDADMDGVVTSVCDGLKVGRVVDDDRRLCALIGRLKAPDPTNPRVEVLVTGRPAAHGLSYQPAGVWDPALPEGLES